MSHEGISSTPNSSSKFIDIDGEKIHYIEMGQGRPILFLHGVPTSSYIWRNVMPHVASLGRCIAPDLMGFGRSAKPNIEYSITDHISYIEKFIQQLGLQDLVLVMHGWGSIIGFHYAMRHENNCAGLAFYEAFLHPINTSDVSLPHQETMASAREMSDTSSLEENALMFIDAVIPQYTIRQLTTEEMQHYREPFTQPGSAKPIKQYIKELPTGSGGSPADKIITAYSEKLAKSRLSKLMLYSMPGFMTTFASASWAKEHLSHLEMLDLGEELHLAQESYPHVMGQSISVWLQSIEQDKR